MVVGPMTRTLFIFPVPRTIETIGLEATSEFKVKSYRIQSRFLIFDNLSFLDHLNNLLSLLIHVGLDGREGG